jgi:holin-like protein
MMMLWPTPRGAAARPGSNHRLARAVATLLFFVVVNRAGYTTAERLHLPLPGNLVGLLLLLALLWTRALKVEWVEDAASLLVRHLAFFFIPITVGLMAYGPLFKHDGLAMLVTLIASAAAGIAATGISTQVLAPTDCAVRARLRAGSGLPQSKGRVP